MCERDNVPGAISLREIRTKISGPLTDYLSIRAKQLDKLPCHPVVWVPWHSCMKALDRPGNLERSEVLKVAAEQ
jgi:hypothetical protein